MDRSGDAQPRVSEMGIRPEGGMVFIQVDLRRLRHGYRAKGSKFPLIFENIKPFLSFRVSVNVVRSVSILRSVRYSYVNQARLTVGKRRVFDPSDHARFFDPAQRNALHLSGAERA